MAWVIWYVECFLAIKFYNTTCEFPLIFQGMIYFSLCPICFFFFLLNHKLLLHEKNLHLQWHMLSLSWENWKFSFTESLGQERTMHISLSYLPILSSLSFLFFKDWLIYFRESTQVGRGAKEERERETEVLCQAQSQYAEIMRLEPKPRAKRFMDWVSHPGTPEPWLCCWVIIFLHQMLPIRHWCQLDSCFFLGWAVCSLSGIFPYLSCSETCYMCF